MRTRLLLSAVLMLAGALPAAEPLRPRIDGESLHAQQVRLFGVLIRDLIATPDLDGQMLVFRKLSGRCAHGRVTGEVRVDLANRLLIADAKVEGMDLSTLLAEINAASTNTGTIDLTFTLTVHFDRPRDTTGSGTCTVRKGELVRLGFLSSLLIGDPTAEPGSDKASCRFELVDGRIRLRGAEISSPGALVRLQGTVGLDGSLDLVAIPYPEFAWLQIVPGVGDATAWLLGSASSHLARARIRGSLGNPAVSITPFAE